jgi:hypothetical protein
MHCKYDGNRSIRNILRVRDIVDRCVTVQFILLQPLRSEKNRVQVVQLPVNWVKTHVIENRLMVNFNFLINKN